MSIQLFATNPCLIAITTTEGISHRASSDEKLLCWSVLVRNFTFVAVREEHIADVAATMDGTRERREFAEIPSTFSVYVPSTVISTVTVLVVDVLVLWFVHHALLKIGALLTVRQVLLKKMPVRFSEMTFEYLTGRTHGPLWFRYTQALVKVICLCCRCGTEFIIQ